MKKFSIVLLLLVLLLGACADNEESTAEEPEEDVSDTEEAVDEEGEEGTGDGSDEGTEEEDASNEEEVNEEEAVEVTVEVEYFIDENSSVIPLEEGVDENVVLLTIDDAPDNYTLEMAETLHELDAGAIFFVNGHFLETPEDEEALRQIHEMGFAIGNHTYSHPVIPNIPEEDQREEIVSLNDRVEEIIGERPKFFRAPHGENSDFSREVVEEEGMVLMNWTYGYDYFEPYMDADKLAEAIITGEAPEIDIDYSLLKPGANILMHDREWTNDALERIVNGLRDSGYEPVDPEAIETMN